MGLDALVLAPSDLNYSTIDTFAGIDQIQALSPVDIDTVQNNLNSKANLQVNNITTSISCISEGNNLPNCMPNSELSLENSNESNNASTKKFEKSTVQDSKLSTAICLQFKGYSSIIDSDPSKNESKTNSNVNFKACGNPAISSLPTTSKVRTKSQNSPINENVSRIETIERSECDLGNMQTEEIMQLNKEKILAIRSLGTNLLLFGLVILISVLYLVPSPTWQSFFTAANESLQKGLLPTLSTMANFGTIRSVALQYWKYSSNKMIQVQPFFRNNV